jgi:hypothetical protein
MIRLLGLLLALMVLVAPVSAGEPSYQDIVQTMGCRAPVFTSNEVSPLSSFYLSHDAVDIWGTVYRSGLYLGTESDVPPELALIIVLHETGHCLQHQAYGDLFEPLYALYPAVFELDADRQAADMACQMGRDGDGLMRQLLEWVHARYGYDGDPDHGTLIERMSMGHGAPACHPVHVQSPFWS